VFADHWLSKKYFQQWQQFLDDESVIHQKHAAGTFLS
jgi:hypothetical protein